MLFIVRIMIDAGNKVRRLTYHVALNDWSTEKDAIKYIIDNTNLSDLGQEDYLITAEAIPSGMLLIQES